MIWFAAATGTIALILILYTLYTAWRHPHLRKMAFRNARLHKTTTILTIIGSMVGTALITAALLLQTSINHSMDRFFEEQFGNISTDIPAAGQKKLNHPYFDEHDLARLQDEVKEAGVYDQLLPTVGFYGTLIKLNAEGKPLLVQPQVYIHAFGPKHLEQFDKKAINLVPADLTRNEVILSNRAAAQLEVKNGDAIQLLLPGKKPLSLTVKKVVPEQGLTGYRGDKKGTATAILSLQTARAALGMKEGYNHVLASSRFPNAGLSDWEQTFVRMFAETDLDGILKFTPFFLIAGLNAIVIGIALVLNIFKMIADERKQELGILRAVGMNRRNLARVLRLEGMIYAIGSGVIGVAAGIGLSYLALWPLTEIFSLAVQYESRIVVRFDFSIDAASLISGFSIGLLLINFSMVWVSRKVAKVPIVDLLNELNQPNTNQKWKRKQTGLRNALSLVLGSVVAAIVVITHQASFQKWLGQYEGLATPINVAIVIAAIGGSIVFIMLGLSLVYSAVQKLFAFHPKMYGMLGIAFRYPELNKKRTGLLLFMFSMVLFLTGFSGIINATFGAFFGDFNGRKATGGYDLTAQANRMMTTEELEHIISRSSYISRNEIETLAAVLQLPSDYFRGTINGIDEPFAKNNAVPLINKDPSYKNDRDVWKEVAQNPDVVILSEDTLIDYSPMGKKLKTGDLVQIYPGVNKKVIGIAKYQKESFGFETSYGAWMKQSELKSLAKDPSELQSALLIRVKDPDQLGKTARSIEKELNLQGIYPLRNPQQYFIASQSFQRTLFTLLEAFSALATVIGITGLMVVMFRMVRERRQQIGMMRAIGIGKRFISWSILMEGSVIAVTGIVLGIVLGCFVGLLIIHTVFEGNAIPIIFPYGKVLFYFGGALLLALICSSLPAGQTMKLSPVEATRYIS